MGLKFSSGLDASGATGKRKSVSAKGAGTADSSRRRSIDAAARSSASASQAAAKQRAVADKKLAKLEAKNAKLEAKNARREAKRARRMDKTRGKEAERASAARASRQSRETAAVQEGERIGDIRKREREQRFKRDYRRYVMRIAIVVCLVAALVIAALYVYRSDLLAITQVEANGVSHLTSQEITELAAVPQGSTYLRLDEEGIVERLESNAWVQSATVTRIFPDTLEIDIVERTAAAVVQLDETSTWVISSDGAWLSAATQDDLESYPLIVDVSSSLDTPVSGSACDDGGIENALAVIDGISDELMAKVESISAESSIQTTLNLEGGITVAFGDSSDIELKESVIDELLELYDGTISYINVRVPSRPTYRTLE